MIIHQPAATSQGHPPVRLEGFLAHLVEGNQPFMGELIVSLMSELGSPQQLSEFGSA